MDIEPSFDLTMEITETRFAPLDVPFWVGVFGFGKEDFYILHVSLIANETAKAAIKRLGLEREFVVSHPVEFTYDHLLRLRRTGEDKFSERKFTLERLLGSTKPTQLTYPTRNEAQEAMEKIECNLRIIKDLLKDAFLPDIRKTSI